MRTKYKPHYEVRFHLSKGPTYKQWQVKRFLGGNREIFYYEPELYQLELIGCKLVNQLGTAIRVWTSGVKDVCGWIRCDDVRINNEISHDGLERLFFNPIKNVHWRRESDLGEFAWDNYSFSSLLTSGRQVYILEERI